MIIAAITTAGGMVGHPAADGGGAQIELWQLINLIGAPLLALLFARPVIDDLKAWIASERELGPD